MSIEELVELLAQETQKFTQLLVEKKFNNHYLESKKTIQEILAEIESRKESPTSSRLQSDSNSSV